MARKKVLFFSHAVTLAHFTRPLKWIESLDAKKYEIYLASHSKYANFVKGSGITFIDISCIEAEVFARRVRDADPIYDVATFEKHIQEDLIVMDQVKPDIVLGDYRLSLSVSCRLRKIKYINITNAYWSPNIKLPFPLPEAPVIRLLGERLSKALLSLFIPMLLKFNFFKLAHALKDPLSKVGLSFTDFRQLLTDGDITAYCEIPELVPLKRISSHERYIGPIIWTMGKRMPVWWWRLNKHQDKILLSLGSSGPVDALPLLIHTLSKLNYEIIVSVAGKKVSLPDYPNVFVADYLPLDEICRHVKLVICNGGSPLSHLALAHGIPCIGIVCNTDQVLNMAHMEKLKLGILLRYWNLSEGKILQAIQRILHNKEYFESCRAIQKKFEKFLSPNHLERVLEELLGIEKDPTPNLGPAISSSERTIQ